jgi:uncharacterized protein YqeY
MHKNERKFFMTLFEQINEGIKEAIRSREQIRLETLRMLKSKIIAVDARGNLADADVVKIFKTYAGNLQEAIEQALIAQRTEMADKLKLELAIVQEFLPKALSIEETEKLVQQAIQETGAKTKKEFGIVMKTLMKLNPTVDGKLAKDLANKFLND